MVQTILAQLEQWYQRC